MREIRFWPTRTAARTICRACHQQKPPRKKQGEKIKKKIKKNLFFL
jgi:hypothetical protein